MEGFPSNLYDTFTSTRGCAEPMLSMCQLKVKVTVKGQILNKQILDIMSCPLYNSFTNGRISFKLEWPIHLNQGMCRAHIFFPQHILPLLPLYNAQWWGYESLTAIVLVTFTLTGGFYFDTPEVKLRMYYGMASVRLSVCRDVRLSVR